MIDIIKNRKVPFVFSSILFIVSLSLLVIFGLRPGIDFTGGSMMQVSFTDNRPEIQNISDSLQKLDFDLGQISIQPTGEKAFILKMKFIDENEHQDILSNLRESFGNEENKVLEDRVETIGPAISSHLKNRAIYAAVAVILAIVFFVGYAFRRVSKPVKSWKYGVTAILALIHDVVITMGVFAVLGKFFGVEVDIPFVVALLTIMGYSVNDTIVVFDRVREKLIKRGSDNFSETVNIGVNETLKRSLNTSLTTLVVLFALFLFGGDSIHYFSLALIIGIIFGTYSSIFLASPLLVVWHKFKIRK